MLYFDLHCDTLGVLYRKGSQNNKKDLVLDINECSKQFEKYSQVFAIYSPNELSENEAFENFVFSADKIRNHKFPKNVTPYLSVEGGKLLCGKDERFEILKRNGVCILTLVWGGLSCIGGAHDTENGFTDFGLKTLAFCLSNGIIPDISHSSDKMFYETAEACYLQKKPFIASHSNSRTVRRHSRNLTDEMFSLISKIGGIVGISLAPAHLTDKKIASVSDVIKHIDYYMSLGGENTVCLGCDYDGTDGLPRQLESPDKLYNLKNTLFKLGYSEGTVNKIFYKNAEDFFVRNNIKPIKAPIINKD